MRSSIKIDFRETSTGLEPFINVDLATLSDDARDKLLVSFFSRLGDKSSFLKVVFEKEEEGR